MSFSDNLAKFNAKQKRIATMVFPAVVHACDDAIRNGSPITGSPGQLVKDGGLKASWQTVMESPTLAAIMTKSAYALQMETGTREGRALTQRSPTGGFHSVQKVIQNFDKLVEHEARKVSQ